MKKKILSMFKEAGLASYSERYERLIRPSIRIHTKKTNEDTIPIGASKIGGCPDFPAHLPWPKVEGVGLLPFIAQINLSELPLEAHEDLPCHGMLYFFYLDHYRFNSFNFSTPQLVYDQEGNPAYEYEKPNYSYEPQTLVYFYEGQMNELIRKEFTSELEVDLQYESCALTYTLEWSVPPSESAVIEELGMSWSFNREDFDKYWEVFLPGFRKEFGYDDGAVNRLLGHPDQIQGDMQADCQYRTYGLTYRKEDEQRRNQVKSGATDWRLLLQIDSEDEKTGMMWGDVGRIYFWIHKDDLKKRNFSYVISVEQCH